MMILRSKETEAFNIKNSNNNNNKTEFSAKEFVDKLLTIGDQVTSDDTNQEFDRNNKLPEYYDEELFRRGQKFFYDNVFANFYGKLMGLLSVLSIPSIRNLLIETKMSSSELSSYRRYLATILHTLVWYDEEPKPGSRFWKSINTIRTMHNRASQFGSKAGLKRISQKDMAITLIGFMGFSITRSQYLGIHDVKEDELKGFIHFWRVIGYLLGIEDRFNICRESVEETQDICKLLIEQVIHHEIEKKDKDFLSLCYYLLKGLWPICPYFQFKSVMCVLHNLTRENYQDMSEPVYYKLNWFQRIHYWLFANNGYLMKNYWYKKISNYNFVFNIWCMKHFPFLAYYFYGIKDATVSICTK